MKMIDYNINSKTQLKQLSKFHLNLNLEKIHLLTLIMIHLNIVCKNKMIEMIYRIGSFLMRKIKK